jgi:nucleoside-diphosphate-sugar epimerase
MASAVSKLLKMEGAAYDTFNLGRGIEYSVVEIVEAFGRQLKEEIKIEVDPARVRKVERQHLLADVNKLKQKAGWEPVWGIDEGIKDLIDNWK